MTILLWALASCGTGLEAPGDTGNWVERPNAYARNFSIADRGAERLLCVFGPGGRQDTLAVHHLAADGSGQLPLPLSRIAVVSTTHLAYIAALSKSEVVAGAAHLQRMPDPSPWTGRTPPVEDIGTATGLDRERLVRLAPQVLLDYPFGKESSARAMHGVPVVAVTEYLEDHPLGRAEWLRFFGVLLGAELRADSLFDAIADRYVLIREHDLAGPTVFFGSAWQGQWHAPGADSYMATLITDAGGRYMLAERSGAENIALDRETVLHHALKADHFGQVLAHAGTVDAMLLAGRDTRIAALDAVRRGGFHANSAQVDLFGQALLEPDMLLLDLRRIFHPERLPDHRPKYFKALDQ